MHKISPPQIRSLAIFSSIVLGILLICLTWYYRDDLFQSLYDPGEPFQTYTPPPAPNYAQANAWLYRPDSNIDPLKFQGGGDAFVVTPTLYLGGKHWNAPTADKNFYRALNRIALPNYVLPFTFAGRVYAPNYRQAALYTFLTNRDDARAAQKFAYRDVKRAFDMFLHENPPERPIVLVGYGQGGLHVSRLLSEYFLGERAQKLAVAYVIDHPLPLGIFENNFSDLKPCETVSDSNCVISFGAFEPHEDKRARNYVTKTLVWQHDDLTHVNGVPILCTNPLLWTQSTDYAPDRLHMGGVAAEGLDANTSPAPASKQTGAQCQDGLLLIDTPKRRSLRRPSRFGGKYRTLAFNLFYEDLRIDAARRVQNLIDKNVLPRRAPLLEVDTIEIENSPVILPLQSIKQ